MKESEFQRKHPNCGYYINIEEFLGGYPYVRVGFVLDSVLELMIDGRTIEECCKIADNIITKIDGKVDYSDTEEYIVRAHSIWDKKMKEEKEVVA